MSELVKRLPDVRLVGKGTVEVTGIAYDSRAVQQGDLFCAIAGGNVNGNDFIPGALKNGANAVLTESLEAVPADVPALIAVNARAAMAYAAHALMGDPTREMTIAGITGTNGKTTCTYILQSIFDASGHRTARIGTTGWAFGGQSEPLERTTPESPDLLALLHQMNEDGATHAVLEVTSIAIPMRRIDGFFWSGALFTNLSQDHLDLHGSMEAYFDAKKQFFLMLTNDAVAVANADDPYGRRMLEGVRADAITFGFDSDADVKGELVEESAAGMVIAVNGRFGEFELKTPYIGRFNASNVLGSATLSLAMGASVDAVIDGVRNAPQVRGRMERLSLEGDVTAVIDYAHTPDALERALAALRPMTDGRLIVIIGAGGDRDPGKRPIMGSIAAKGADIAIITSDNPRSEDPAKIVEQVMAGARAGSSMKGEDSPIAIVLRREAIAKAIEIAKPGDVVLVAGKGHETYQEMNGVKHHFDDREEVLKLRSLKTHNS